MSLIEQNKEFLKQKQKERERSFKKFVDDILDYIKTLEKYVTDEFMRTGKKEYSFHWQEKNIPNMTKEEKSKLIEEIRKLEFKGTKLKCKTVVQEGYITYKITFELVTNEIKLKQKYKSLLDKVRSWFK